MHQAAEAQSLQRLYQSGHYTFRQVFSEPDRKSRLAALIAAKQLPHIETTEGREEPSQLHF